MLELNTYLQTLHDLHASDECVLVGLGLELPKLLLGMDFQKIVAAEADLREIEKVSKVYDLSERFFITDSLIAKDDTDAKFQIASNPSANTFADIEDFREIYPNIALRQTLEKPSISLDTFMSNNDLQNAKWLILNTLNSKAILEYNELGIFDVIVCKIVKSELSEVQTKLEEDDFKHLRCFEKQNPKILWSIFVKDTQKLTAQKAQELQERLKQTTDEKEQTVKQLQEEQTKVQKLTQDISKSKEELAALKKLTTQKEQELQEKLKQATQAKELTVKQLQEQQTKVKEFELKQKESDHKLKEKLTQTQQLQEKEKSYQDKIKTLENNLDFFKKLVIITDKEYFETEFILKQQDNELTVENFQFIALAENALKHKKYKESIFYWQKLASKLENKMPQLYYRRLAFAYSHIGGYPLGNEAEEALHGSFDKHEALSQLHEILEPNLYMEIGVQTGKSLRLAKCKALGIDPMPMLNEPLSINMEVIEQTSDAFFETYAKKTLSEPLDFVFIDGMHLFEYALRDFMNVERYSSNKTTVVVDDIYPGHESQAARDRKTRAWTGDVWKLLAILTEYRGDLKITTLDIHPTGLMVVQNLDNKNSVLQENYDEIVEKYMNKEIDKKLYIERRGAVEPTVFLANLKEEI